MELDPHGVIASAVAPGFVRIDMTRPSSASAARKAIRLIPSSSGYTARTSFSRSSISGRV
jgi:NAD(P)-dependent dehydrogenase (short-subunit alcohol dehydrogenase family)